MKLNVLLQSQSTPFEGDCILELRGLPANAVVTGASARITPSEAEEQVSLEGPPPLPWGITLDGNIVDFHARRIVSQARLKTGQTATQAHVRVDMGGLWVALNNDGSVAVPDTGSQDFTVSSRAIDTRGVATSRLQVTTADGNETLLTLSRVTWRSLASNVSLRLSEQGPFLFTPGDMRTEAVAPDFSEALRAYLRTAETENGQYVVPMVLHSDTIACLDVVIDIDYTQEQNALPPAVKEVAVQYTLDPLPQGQKSVVDVMLPANARVIPGLTTARVRGTFAPDRVVFGSTDPVDSANSVRVSPAASFAQRIQVPEDLTASAIDLYVQPSSRTARLTLTLLDDAGGKPFGPALMPPASLALSPQPDGPAWMSTRLPREFQFSARLPDNRPRSYWLVVQIAEGEVDWGIEPTAGWPVGLLTSQDNHLTWQNYRSPLIPDAINGLFRLRWTPPLYTVPIQVMIGEGEAVQKISLDRFQPQGRIDFRLDFPEIAQAFNQYLAAKNEVACPRVETLANAEFEEWTRIGDAFGEPQNVPFGSQPLAVAVSPGGDRLLVAGSGEGQMALEIYDGCSLMPYHRLLLMITGNTITYTPETVLILPDGKLALVTCRVSSSLYLFLIDLEPGSQVGSAEQIQSMGPGRSTKRIAISPDGNMLYTGGDFYITGNMEGEIRRYDMRALEQDMRSGSTATYAERMPLPNSAYPAALAITPDGMRLFVITSDGMLYGYQTQPFRQVFGPVVVGADGPWNLVLIHHGDQAIVINQTTGSLMIIDTFTGQLIGPSVTKLHLQQPAGIAVTRDERLVLVTDREDRTVRVIDIHTMTEVSRAYLSGAPGALALSAQEHLAFLASSSVDNQDLIVLPFGVPALEEWTLTAGYLMPTFLPDPFHLSAELGRPFESKMGVNDALPDSNSGLSQVVPVTAGCTYALNFWGLATNRSALAEVLWRSPACGQVRRDEIHFEELETQEKLRRSSQTVLMDLKPHQADLAAPEGATQAEIQFTTPPGVYAIVDTASFMPAPALANGNLQQEEDGVLASWEVEPADAAGLNLVASSASVTVRNSGTAQAVMKQRLRLPAGQPFQLIFNGSRGSSGSALVNPRIEVSYLDAVGSAVSPASGFDIETGRPPEQKIEATAPAGTTQVEVRLVLPAGSALEVVNLTLEPLVLVRVPVTFLSQTIGQLVLTDFHVAYELVISAPLSVPADGLCTATPPGQQPGAAPADSCYCPCCHAERKMTMTANMITAAGRPAASGTCRTCGARITRVGGQQETPAGVAAQPAAAGEPVRAGLKVIRTRAQLPALPLERSAAAPQAAAVEETQPVEMPGIIAVRGIGPDLAQRLEQIGITTLEQLAAAQPDEITQVRGITLEKAMTFIKDARRLRRQAEHRTGGAGR